MKPLSRNDAQISITYGWMLTQLDKPNGWLKRRSACGATKNILSNNFGASEQEVTKCLLKKLTQVKFNSGEIQPLGFSIRFKLERKSP